MYLSTKLGAGGEIIYIYYIYYIIILYIILYILYNILYIVCLMPHLGIMWLACMIIFITVHAMLTKHRDVVNAACMHGHNFPVHACAD